MRPFSLEPSYINPLTVYEMSRQCRVVIHSKKELFEAARVAVRQSLSCQISAQFFWADVMGAAIRLKVLPEQILFGEAVAGRSFCEHVIDAKDWLSCSVFLRYLENGLYADGKVTKTDKTLTFALDDSGKTFGYLEYSPGSWYDGEMVNYMREGQGVFKSKYSTSHYGEWKKNETHGYGCAETTFPRYAKDEGRYQCGLLVEPKKNKSLWRRFIG